EPQVAALSQFGLVPEHTNGAHAGEPCAPAGNSVHSPSCGAPAATEHALQEPSQAESQQRPSLQKPVGHSAPDVHGSPVSRSRSKTYTEPCAWTVMSSFGAPTMTELLVKATDAPKSSLFWPSDEASSWRCVHADPERTKRYAVPTPGSSPGCVWPKVPTTATSS